MKKILAILLAAILVVGTLTACGSGDANTDGQNTQGTEQSGAYKSPTGDISKWQAYTPEEHVAEDTTGKEIAYQFVTSHADNKNISLMLNLYEDGYARMSQYSEGNNGVMNYYYHGYWNNMEDEYLYVGFTCYSYAGEDVPSQNVAKNDVCAVDYSYELSKADGNFAFSLNACLGFGDGGVYVRSANVTGDGAVQYKTEAEFVAYADDYWANYEGESNADAPEDIVIPENSIVIENFSPDISSQIADGFFVPSDQWGPVLTASGSYTATDSEDTLFTMTSTTGKPFSITFYANGTYLFEYSGMVSEEGTWTWKDWSMTVTTPKGVSYTGGVK